MAVIRIPEAEWVKARTHLLSGPGEHFAFMLAEHCKSSEGPVFLVKEVLCVPPGHVKALNDGWVVKPDGFLLAINAAVRSGLALIEAHNHGGQQPRFSLTDYNGLGEFSAYALDSLPERPYAATVWGDTTVYGEFFSPDGSTGAIRSIAVSGARPRQIGSRDDDLVPVEGTFDRQLPWFTDEGQQHLGRMRVAIVGAGGTGSHVAQQLVFLGIRDYVIVDGDSADETSMNRLVTAGAADIGTAKAILARRVIKSIAPTATVKLITSSLQTRGVIPLLKTVDVIFGCVDNDGARLILNEIAIAFCIPYFDLAVGIDVAAEGPISAGGRVAVIAPGGPCLYCLNEIDVDEARFFLSDAEERAFMIERGYVHGVDIPSPSVVSLNAAVAASAVNEFAVVVSGLRPLNVFTDFDVLGTAFEVKGQRVGPRRVSPNPDCVACTNRGLGDRAAVDRYERMP